MYCTFVPNRLQWFFISTTLQLFEVRSDCKLIQQTLPEPDWTQFSCNPLSDIKERGIIANGRCRRQVPTKIVYIQRQKEVPIRPFWLRIVQNLQQHCTKQSYSCCINQISKLFFKTDLLFPSLNGIYLHSNLALLTEADRYFSSQPPVHWFLALPPPHNKINLSCSQNKLSVDKVNWGGTNIGRKD